jgi:hypothetical protein
MGLAVFSQVEERVAPETKKEEKQKLPFSQRLVFGGDIGLSFGTITYIRVAPIVGYRITDRLVAGLGPMYIYEKYKNYNLESSTYGLKTIASFTVIKGSDVGGSFGFGSVVFHLENEVVNVEPYDPYYGYFGDRIWIDNLLIGGGLSQTLGGSFGISVFILWDITQNINSPYYRNNPVLKFGFYF